MVAETSGFLGAKPFNAIASQRRKSTQLRPPTQIRRSISPVGSNVSVYLSNARALIKVTKCVFGQSPKTWNHFTRALAGSDHDLPRRPE